MSSVWKKSPHAQSHAPPPAQRHLHYPSCVYAGPPVAPDSRSRSRGIERMPWIGSPLKKCRRLSLSRGECACNIVIYLCICLSVRREVMKIAEGSVVGFFPRSKSFAHSLYLAIASSPHVIIIPRRGHLGRLQGRQVPGEGLLQSTTGSSKFESRESVDDDEPRASLSRFLLVLPCPSSATRPAVALACTTTAVTRALATTTTNRTATAGKGPGARRPTYINNISNINNINSDPSIAPRRRRS